MIAEIIINRTAKKLNRTFDYQIPKEMEEYIYIGTKVLVPFGRAKKLEEGFVVGFKEKTEYEVKEIAKIEDNLTEKQIELAKWMAKKYYCSVTDCIKLMQTPGTRTKENKIKDKTINSVYLKKEAEEIVLQGEKEVERLLKENQKNIESLDKDYQAKIEYMIENNQVVQRANERAEAIKDKAEKYKYEMIESSNQYAEDVLSFLEQKLEETLEEVKNNKRELNPRI